MYIILFDGVCNFCNGTINFVIDRDAKGLFKFAALQSEAGQALLRQYQLPTQQFDSFVLVTPAGKVYRKSGAALRVATRLGRLWPLMALFFVIPAFVRDAVYDFIARNRYKWFGKQDSCRMPTPALRARFL